VFTWRGEVLVGSSNGKQCTRGSMRCILITSSRQAQLCLVAVGGGANADTPLPTTPSVNCLNARRRWRLCYASRARALAPLSIRDLELIVTNWPGESKVSLSAFSIRRDGPYDLWLEASYPKQSTTCHNEKNFTQNKCKCIN